MIFRFKSKLETQDRLHAFPFPVAGKENGVPFSARTIAHHQDSFSEKLTKIILHPISNVETYGIDLLFDGEADTTNLPDVWGVEKYLIVSDSFKTLLSGLDSIKHNFMECRWLDKNLQKVNLDQKYYWFLPNRYFQFNGNVTPSYNPNFYLEDDENCIDILMSNGAHILEIEQCLLWQCLVPKIKDGKFTPLRTVIYFNDVLWEEMKSKNLKGMELYTCFNGAGEESVVML